MKNIKLKDIKKKFHFLLDWFSSVLYVVEYKKKSNSRCRGFNSTGV